MCQKPLSATNVKLETRDVEHDQLTNWLLTVVQRTSCRITRQVFLVQQLEPNKGHKGQTYDKINVNTPEDEYYPHWYQITHDVKHTVSHSFSILFLSVFDLQVLLVESACPDDNILTLVSLGRYWNYFSKFSVSVLAQNLSFLY